MKKAFRKLPNSPVACQRLRATGGTLVGHLLDSRVILGGLFTQLHVEKYKVCKFPRQGVTVAPSPSQRIASQPPRACIDPR